MPENSAPRDAEIDAAFTDEAQVANQSDLEAQGGFHEFFETFRHAPESHVLILMLWELQRIADSLDRIKDDMEPGQSAWRSLKEILARGT
ncbi:MAG: hypothetical protein H7841_04220 [Magnetospirillum sp. WYHS-4]